MKCFSWPSFHGANGVNETKSWDEFFETTNIYWPSKWKTNLRAQPGSQWRREMAGSRTRNEAPNWEAMHGKDISKQIQLVASPTRVDFAGAENRMGKKSHKIFHAIQREFVKWLGKFPSWNWLELSANYFPHELNLWAELKRCSPIIWES